MTKLILFTCLLISGHASLAQNAKLLFQQSYAASQKIKNGYYEMEKSLKPISDKDTNTFKSSTCYFKKITVDSQPAIAFNRKDFYNGQYIKNILYTGNDYAVYSSKDSTGQIMSKTKWAKEIMSKKPYDMFDFYTAFAGKDFSPFPKASDYADNKHLFKFIGKEKLNNFSCYHIQMTEFPKYDSTDVLHILKTSYDFWINSRDMIPIKYSASSDVLNGADTSTEYLSFSLKKYRLNNLQKQDLTSLQLSSIPSYCILEDYVATNAPELLKRDSLAPDLNLLSIDNKKISLADFKGQLIIVDFFYTSCYPCLKSLPVLQSLSEKYKSKGLKIIGIDPVDKEEDGVKKFVSKHKITYTIVLDNENVANGYHISRYPTVYLIGKDGKIIFATMGFAKESETDLEEYIKRYL